MEEYVGSNTSTNIVLWYSMVDIGTIGMVDDFSWCWILNVVSNVVIHHDNDVIIWNTMGSNNLVGVTNICLMAVVEPSIAASHKEDPQLSILKYKYQKE